MIVMTDIALEPTQAWAHRTHFESRPNAALAARAAGVPVLDVVVPVYNEQAALADSVHRLHRHLRENFPFEARITIADNASVDDTPRIAAELAAELTDVRVVRLEQKGRGRALHAVWSTSDAPVLAYMDVDLSTDLAALAPLVAPLISGHSDLAIGTRLGRGARVVRGPKREIISRCYNLILKSTLAARFSDAQCGFKAIRADVAERLLPHVADTGWFFDTELLVLAERSGLRIHEVPVDWVDDPDSRVDIVATATADLKGIGRMLRGFADGSIPVNTIAAQLGSSRLSAAPGSLFRQVVRFGAVGVASTAAYRAAVHADAGVGGRSGGEPDRVAAHRDWQHRRQPALHVRGRRSRQCDPPPLRGPRGLRNRAGDHQRRAGRAARCGRPAAPLGRTHGVGARQSGGHRGSLRTPARLGVSPRPVALTPTNDKRNRLMTITSEVPPQTTAAPHGPPRRDPRWVRPAVLALLAATAVLYLWGLGSSGWANNYYAAAAQAGTQDWKAWLFGSLDAGNAITVDKPPAALWVMGLFGRLFGFNAFTMLLPEALMGVAAVALLYATVRRTSGPAAGLIAGAVLALTPVAALMFRFNNPDALLVLLLVAAAYCMVRATETASTRWIALAGCVIGFAFLTKMLQAFLIVPGLATGVPRRSAGWIWKRIGKLLVGAATMVVSAGWYIALVSLWPADSRPYIGGSTDNSLLQLALGYNGIERIAGGDGGPGGGPGRRRSRRGQPVLRRRTRASADSSASRWVSKRPGCCPPRSSGLRRVSGSPGAPPRTGTVRAGLLLWGGWLLVTGAVFSFMDGTVHPYYTVALAPAVAALVGISVAELWRGREFLVPRIVLATMAATTGVWAFILLDRTPDWLPALRWIVLAGSVVVAAILAVGAAPAGPCRGRTGHRRSAFRPGCAYRIFDLQRHARAQWAGHDVRAQP